MATANSFEDLEVWRLARQFSKRIFVLTRAGDFAKDFSLKDQINASTGSTMDNVAEGFERGGNKEFVTFLSYSKGSCGESRSQLYRAFDRGYIDEATLEQLLDEGKTISRKLSSLMTYLQKGAFKGSKFH